MKGSPVFQLPSLDAFTLNMHGRVLPDHERAPPGDGIIGMIGPGREAVLMLTCNFGIGWAALNGCHNSMGGGYGDCGTI